MGAFHRCSTPLAIQAQGGTQNSDGDWSHLPSACPWEATGGEAGRIPHLQSRLMVPCLHTHLRHLISSSNVTSLALGWRVDLDANGV